MLINPIQPAANAFLIIWQNLPLPFRALFLVGLTLVLLYAIYRILAR